MQRLPLSNIVQREPHVHILGIGLGRTVAFRRKEPPEPEIVAHLFKLYAEKTANHE